MVMGPQGEKSTPGWELTMIPCGSHAVEWPQIILGLFGFLDALEYPDPGSTLFIRRVEGKGEP